MSDPEVCVFVCSDPINLGLPTWGGGNYASGPTAGLWEGSGVVIESSRQGHLPSESGRMRTCILPLLCGLVTL